MLHGVTEHEHLGVLVPTRVSLISGLGESVLLNLWASNELSLRDNRAGSPQHALFGDELRAGMVVRLGRSGTERGGHQQVSYGSGTSWVYSIQSA
ncbi:MAG: hypothetical protein GY811_25795 [Myxococcales bacterium]|nr:hypothetical protein [Myxococcales bacterium]